MRFTGLAAWWVQRLSAVYMLAFVVFLLGTFALDPVHDYAQWHGWVSRPSIKATLIKVNHTRFICVMCV